jgi:hypothetical protein
MSTAADGRKAHHPLLVSLVTVVVSLPATAFTWLANSMSKDGPSYSELHFAVLAVACACGFGMYLFQLRIDPNVPRYALLPAALTSFVSSAVASAAACVWFL